jgi:hypothetical protein
VVNGDRRRRSIARQCNRLEEKDMARTHRNFDAIEISIDHFGEMGREIVDDDQ